MGDARTMPRIRDNDWVTLRRALNTLSKLSFGQEASPTFGGLSLRGDIDMNDNAITDVGYIDFNLTNGVPAAEGRLKWNPDDGTLEVGMPGGSVNLQIGQEMLIRVTNGTGSDITNGTPVYISGASGTNIIVGLGDADFATGVGLRTIAVATETIAAGLKGYVTTDGLVREVDTSAFAAAGVPVYLAKGGGLATAPPTSPDVTYVIGVVVRKHATEGVMQVLQTSLPNLNSLSDVLLSGLANNEILNWDTASSTWMNTADPTFTGLTVTGGADIGTFLEVGTDVTVQGLIYCDDLTSNYSGLITITSDVTMPFATILTLPRIVFDFTGSSYSIKDRSGVTLAFEGDLAGFGAAYEFYNSTGDATLNTWLRVFGRGTSDLSAVVELLELGYSSSNTWNFIHSDASGTGSVLRPLNIYCGTFTTQLVLDTGGNVNVGNNLVVTGTTNLKDNLTLPKTSGKGIMVDSVTPTFGFRDLLNKIYVRDIGSGTAPGWATFRGNIKQYQFQANDEAWVEFHIPHDHVPGTDIFIHTHWSHNGTLVTGGSVTWGFDVTYAKGYNQAAFPATVNPSVVGTAHATQYQHEITEVQLSAGTPSAVQIDTDDLEVDGLALVRVYLSANNITVSGGAVPDPFMHYCDLHYQSTNLATKDKNTPFYT